jgi:hypothetical protein
LLESVDAVWALLSPVGSLELRWRDVADWLQEPADQLGLVQPDDRLGQGIVIAVAAGADRGDRASFGEPFGVGVGQVLAAPVRLMHQPVSWVCRRQMAISSMTGPSSTRARTSGP